MKVAFTFRNLESSDGLKTYATEKIGKLQKFLHTPLDATVILTTERHLHKVELSVQADGEHYLGHESSEDMYASLDAVIDKVLRQIRDKSAEKKTRMRHPHDGIKTKG